MRYMIAVVLAFFATPSFAQNACNAPGSAGYHWNAPFLPICQSGQALNWNGSAFTCINASGGSAVSPGLPAAPSPCASGTYVTAQDQSGNLTCNQVQWSQISGTPLSVQNAAHAGTCDVATSAGTATTAGSATSAPWSGITGKPATFPATTPVTTATALSVAPQVCPTGQVPRGVDASGNALGCSTVSAPALTAPTASVLGGVKGTSGSTLCSSGYTLTGFNADGSMRCTSISNVLSAIVGTGPSSDPGQTLWLNSSIVGTSTLATSAACSTAPYRTSTATADHGYGTVHYFCNCDAGAAGGCVNGDDANTGLDSTHPKRTYGAIATTFSSMPGGDTVALCQGGAWTGQYGGVANSNCTATATCDLREYPIGGAGPAPLFNGAGSGYMFTFSGNNEGYRFWNVKVQLGAGDTGFWTTGQAYSHYLAYFDLCNVTMDGGLLAIGIQYGNGPITIRNSHFSNFSQHAILAGNNNLTIDSNVFTNNGAYPCAQGNGMCHQVYIAGGAASDNAGPNGWTNETVSNNQFIATGSGFCGGPQVIAHGKHYGLSIVNNLIDTTATTSSTGGGCYGIDVSCQYGDFGCQYQNLKVQRNRIFQGVESGFALGVSNAAGPLVTDNIVYMASQSNGIGVPAYSKCSGLTPPCTNMQTSDAIVQNNSVYMPGGVIAGGAGVMVGGEGSGYAVDDNAVWTTTSGGGSCQLVSSTTVHTPAGNMCRTSGALATAWWIAPGVQGNFTPAAGSPLIGAGDPTYYSSTGIGSAVWSPTDYGVPRSPPIDAGALNH